MKAFMRAESQDFAGHQFSVPNLQYRGLDFQWYFLLANSQRLQEPVESVARYSQGQSNMLCVYQILNINFSYYKKWNHRSMCRLFPLLARWPHNSVELRPGYYWVSNTVPRFLDEKQDLNRKNIS